MFDSLDKVENALENPEKNFGPPPYMHATSGRMNATGIPVFYGALSPEIAIAEVRPAVGSYVVVAQFRPVRPLQILDISALDKITPYTKSLFDPVAAEKLAIASFLRKLSQKLTTPVSGQRTDHEYLITQAVSEYLSVSETYALDGIRFSSTQQSQETDNEIKDYNIVLFSKSATVLNADNPNLQYWVELMEDEYYEDECYSRLEPRIYEKIINKNSFMSQHENRPAIVHHLVLDTSCLTIHEIKGVIYQSTEYSVTLGRPINFEARGSS
ncbi:TPA: RES family NAD+ phosphorylase [Aeromonas veronii]